MEIYYEKKNGLDAKESDMVVDSIAFLIKNFIQSKRIYKINLCMDRLPTKGHPKNEGAQFQENFSPVVDIHPFPYFSLFIVQFYMFLE